MSQKLFLLENVSGHVWHKFGFGLRTIFLFPLHRIVASVFSSTSLTSYQGLRSVPAASGEVQRGLYSLQPIVPQMRISSACFTVSAMRHLWAAVGPEPVVGTVRDLGELQWCLVTEKDSSLVLNFGLIWSVWTKSSFLTSGPRYVRVTSWDWAASASGLSSDTGGWRT